MRTASFVMASILAICPSFPMFAQKVGGADAESYARDVGVDVEEAVRRFSLQALAGDLDALLADRETSTYAGLWIQHAPKYRVITQFTSNGPKDITQYLAAGSPLVSVIEVRVVETSYERLILTQKLLLLALRGMKYNLDINIPANRVEVYVLDEAAIKDSLMRNNFPLPAHAQIVLVPRLAKDEAEIYAGLPLRGCTAGWSVVSSGTITGIATSGHCSNFQFYDGVQLPLVVEEVSGSCDVQWHRDSTHTAVPKFIGNDPASPRQLRDIRPRSRQAVGSFVCKYGSTTRYTCGYIHGKDYKPTKPLDATATYIRVHRVGVDLSDQGDSGGPWFNSNTGFGVHKCGIGDDACYMAVDFVASCLGVTVQTR